MYHIPGLKMPLDWKPLGKLCWLRTHIPPRTRQSELTGPGVGWSSGDQRLYAVSLPVASTSFGLTDIFGYDSFLGQWIGLSCISLQVYKRKHVGSTYNLIWRQLISLLEFWP
jgi:hypothetical protein